MSPHERLEREWSDWSGMPHCVAVASGTAALHLALEAWKAIFHRPWMPTPSVVMPDYGMVACPRAAVMANLHPTFVDCDRRTLLTVEYDQYAVGGYVAMPVYVYGRTCEMDFSPRQFVIEDLSEGHGIAPRPGSFAACWSCYRNKIVHGYEGGMIGFRDRESANLVRSLRSLGFTDAHDYTHIPRGVNARMSDQHAEAILTSLRNFDEEIRRRRETEAAYDEATPVEWRMPERDAPWVYDLRIPGLTAEKQREAIESLRREGTAARYGFKPMRSLPEFADPADPPGPEATAASREVIYLPLDVTPETAGRTIRSLEHVIRCGPGAA